MILIIMKLNKHRIIFSILFDIFRKAERNVKIDATYLRFLTLESGNKKMICWRCHSRQEETSLDIFVLLSLGKNDNNVHGRHMDGQILSAFRGERV